MDLKWLPILCIVTLAGCADMDSAPVATHTPEAQPAESTPDPQPTAPPPSTTPVEPAPHGEPEYTWGAIEEGRQGNKFTATRTVHVTNGIGAAERIDLSLVADYSNVVVAPANVGSYVYEYVLTVQADSQATARDGLEEVDLRHQDTLITDTLTLSSDPSFGPTSLINIGINGQNPQRHLTFDVVIQVPYHLVHDLSFDADYSDIIIGPLDIDSIDLDMDYSEFVATPTGLQSLAVDIDYSDVVLQQVTTPTGSFDVTMDYSDLVISFQEVAPMRVEADQDYSDITVLVAGVEQIDDDEDEPIWESRDYQGASQRLDIILDLDYSDVILR